MNVHQDPHPVQRPTSTADLEGAIARLDLARLEGAIARLDLATIAGAIARLDGQLAGGAILPAWHATGTAHLLDLAARIRRDG